jgi:hypothetical protein
MKTAAIITTVIATFLFLITSFLLTNDSVGRSTKDGILIFNFGIWYAIPALLWLAYLLTNKSK